MTTAPSPVVSGWFAQPDGLPAVAAAVDVMFAGRALERAVTGYDGAFAVDLPETPETIAAAAASGGSVTFDIRATDLIPAESASGTPLVEGVVGRRPVVLQTVTRVIAFVVNTATGAVQDADDLQGYTHLDDLQFRVPPLNPDKIVGQVQNYLDQAGYQAEMLAIFNDPDMVLGNENLNDPDLVPHLGLTLSTMSGALAILADPDDGGDGIGAGDISDLAGISDGPTEEAGCYRTEPTRRWGGKDGAKPAEGVDWYIYLIVFKCKDTSDKNDYFLYKWEGKARTLSNFRLWRLKFRMQVKDEWGYRWESPSPTDDITTDSQQTVNWNVGVNYKWAYGEVGGSYTFKKKKIHPWQDTEGLLLHTSWLSDHKYGTSGDNFWNGFGWGFLTDNGETGQKLIPQVQTWTCHWEKRTYSAGYACDGGR